MMPQPPRRLARFVEPDVDDKRIDRVWAAVASRPVRSWPVWRMTAFAGAALAVAVVVLVLRARPGPSDLAGVVVESGPSQTVTMPDGTSATLREGARLRYDRVQSDRVEATVERGEVTFDVRHTDARVFVVHAGRFDVVDRGTRFSVGVDGEGVRVTVETGSVEIAEAHGAPTRTLAGGESWASNPRTATAPVDATAVAQPPPLDSAPAASVAASSPTAMESAHAPSPPGPRELLQTANDARLAGHPREAAVAFDSLRRHYRSDPRAGLAAFELGRLRLDSLGDPSGAAEALSDSIALAPGATFREDAEARLVEALDRAHDGRCAGARKGYLVRFPGGLHAASVAARCP